jgi:hypothetical protein
MVSYASKTSASGTVSEQALEDSFLSSSMRVGCLSLSFRELCKVMLAPSHKVVVVQGKWSGVMTRRKEISVDT